MTPPADDLQRRRPVWEAMSALFLDTEIDEAWHARIVETLIASRYSIRELDAIFWTEVCPVLHANLLDVAGQWAGFDMERVERQILTNPANWFRRWRARHGGGKLVRSNWERLKESIRESVRR